MYIYTARRRCRFRNVINWWYLPIAIGKLAGLVVVGTVRLLALAMPLWFAAGVVGLI